MKLEREQALKNVDNNYYDMKSKYYRDNEYFSSCVKQINNRFDNNDF